MLVSREPRSPYTWAIAWPIWRVGEVRAARLTLGALGVQLALQDFFSSSLSAGGGTNKGNLPLRQGGRRERTCLRSAPADHALASHSSMAAFYIYPDAAMDQSTAVLECRPSWSFDDQSAEVAMLALLRQHPARVTDPEAATLFVVPLMPYVSSGAGECMGESHQRRMSRAASALQKSPFLSRRGGHDHLLITNTFRVKTFAPWLKPLLGNATIAWFEQPRLATGERRPGVLYSLAFWRCTVVIPYLANPFCAQQRAAAPEAAHPSSGGAVEAGASLSAQRARRHVRAPGSVFFQGSFSAASYLRGRFASLQDLPGAHVQDVPRGCSESQNASLRPECAASRLRGSPLHTARGMLSHEFCLVPRGDTPSSGRLYAALACRCVPLLIANRFAEHFAFPTRGRYDEWVVSVPEGEFMRSPRASIEGAIHQARPQLTRIRSAMEAAGVELLYDAAGSRAADNMLRDWSASCATGGYSSSRLP